MTCDQATGGYQTYAGLEPHRALVAARAPQDWRSATDEVCVAALAALAATESAAFGPENQVVRARMRGVARLLARTDVLAPGFPVEAAVVADLAAALADPRESLPALATSMERTAKSVRELVAEDVATVVDRTVLPTTRLHDEIMFIRSIQIFETLYEQVGRSVADAVRVTGDGDPGGGAEVLGAVTGRLAAVSALFRVLGTMPVEVFAVIRGFTSGRSAVQSLTYRQIEDSCAPRERPHGPPGTWTGPTLQDVCLSARPGPAADRLAAEMRRLDAAWRRMKRGHWGLTLRIIGTVPGTGGTAGASYLRGAAEMPLFPALTGV
jgi:tryptophan 2,3-dioxygenase